MLILDPEFIEVKFKGQVYKIEEPSHKKLKELYEETSKVENKKQALEAERNFFASLGLPGEVYDEIGPRKAKIIIDSFNELKN